MVPSGHRLGCLEWGPGAAWAALCVQSTRDLVPIGTRWLLAGTPGVAWGALCGEVSRQSSDSTDTIGLIIEIVFGLFGMLGMGWIYVGRVGTGIALFGGWLLAVLTVTVLVTVATFGLGIGCLAILVPLQLVIAIVSGLRVRDHVRNTGARGSVGNLIIAAVGGSVLLCLALAIPLLLFGGAAVRYPRSSVWKRRQREPLRRLRYVEP